MKKNKYHFQLNIKITMCVIFVIICIGNFQIVAMTLDPPFFEDEIDLINDSEIWIGSNDLTYYSVSGTSALAALDVAARIGGFDYSVSDEWVESFGLLVTGIADQDNEGTDGWQYWVNYPDEDIPMDAAENYELEDGDTVDWFYAGYGVSPDTSVMDIKLHISIKEDSSPPTVEITVPKEGGIYVNGRELVQIQLPFSIIIGQGGMTAIANDDDTNIFNVAFIVDDIVKKNDSRPPYTYELDGLGSTLHMVSVQAFDGVQKTAIDQQMVLFLSN